MSTAFGQMTRGLDQHHLEDLIEENRQLRDTIYELEHNLRRKYGHCHKLRAKVERLEQQLERHGPTFISQAELTATPTNTPNPEMTTSIGMDEMSSQIVQFADQTAGYTQGIMGSNDETYKVSDANNSSLGEFLSRPVRISTLTWDVGQNLATRVRVWDLFMSNPAVAEKLSNFELLRNNLHLKILISGSPFHYGKVVAAYNPYDENDFVTQNRGVFPQDVVGLSQKPHVWLDPSSNSGGQIDCPFFFSKNYMSITAGDGLAMGSLYLHSTQPLRHANEGNDSVTISVYAWASDVTLAAPTGISAVRVQRQMFTSQAVLDEYGQGILSKPASAVAQAAQALRRIPIMAPYARATQMVAGSVANAAYLLGFSRPPIVTDIGLYKPFPQGNLANTDAAEAVSKLTLDSKQELTVDSRTVGLSGKDEMIIDDIVARESFVTSFDMSDTDAVDDTLFSAWVTPQLWNEGFGEYHLTPAAHIAGLFRYWHGTVKFRFQIVKTPYHKGRIAVRFDPNRLNPSININETYTRIIDIAEEDEFEIEIGWAQSDPFLQTRQVANSQQGWLVGGIMPPDGGTANGAIGVSVVNQLVGPSVDSQISFNVLTSFHNAKFGMPAPSNMTNQSWFEPPEENRNTGLRPKKFQSQAEMVEAGAQTSPLAAPEGAPAKEDIMAPEQSSDHYNEVFFGESPHSLRELLKRYTKMRTFIYPDASENTLANSKEIMRIFPYYRGYDPQGKDNTSTEPVNYVQNTMLNMLAPLYAGMRGNIRHKFLYSGKSSLSNPMITSSSVNATNPYSLTTTFLTGTNIERGISASLNTGISSLFGRATTNLGINDTIEVELPFYSPQRMWPARAINGANNLNRSFTAEATVGEEDVLAYDEYVAAGEDFSLFFFTGVPRQFYYDLTGAE